MKLKKLFAFLTFFAFTSFLLLELAIRILTVEKKEGYEYFLGKPWRYVLPFTPQIGYSDTSKVAKYNVYDDSLGWDIGIQGKNPPLYYSNSVGIRCSEKNYLNETDSLNQHYDIICIGDSFTHGDAVVFEETWPFILDSLTGKNVLNLGVGGYGIDQATLKCKRFFEKGIKTDTVLLGLIAGDMERALSTIYNFYNGGIKTKPKFDFKGNRVKILNQPCAVNGSLENEYKNYKNSILFNNVPGFIPQVFQSTVWDNLYIYRIIRSTAHQIRNRKDPVYRTKDERFDYCIKIIEYLHNLCKKNDAKLIVLLLGNNNTFEDRKILEDPWRLIEMQLQSMHVDFFNADNYQYKKYLENTNSIIHPKEGVHYSAEGNQFLARLLIDKLGI